MSLESIASLISTIGFPIAVCLLLCWLLMEEMKHHEDEVKQILAVLSEIQATQKEYKAAVEANTAALEHFCEIIKEVKP